MNRLIRFISVAALLAASSASLAHDYTAGDLHLGHPWTRATPPGAPTAAGFLTIENPGDAADRLLGGSTEVADRVEIHEMSMANGVMTMRRLDEGLSIPPGGAVALEPGGYHLMLIGLGAPLAPGDTVPLTLTFERAGEVAVELTVEAIGVGGAHDGMSHD